MSDQLHLQALQALVGAVNKIVLALGALPLSTANGGTGTTTTFTLGSVVFAGTDGVYTQDNSNVFWDNTNNRLGLGTTSPTATLSVVGQWSVGAPVTKTLDFSLGATENWVINNRAATNTVTLPAASSWTGRIVTMSTIQAQTVVSASSNVVPLVGGAAGTAILAGTAGKWATLVSDGTNWVVMAGN